MDMKDTRERENERIRKTERSSCMRRNGHVFAHAGLLHARALREERASHGKLRSNDCFLAVVKGDTLHASEATAA